MKRSRRPSSYGIGRVYLRGNRYWIGYYVDAKEVREPSGSSDKRIAEELLAQRIRERSRGEITSLTSLHTISAVLQDFLDHKKKLAPGTRATYEYQVETHLNPFFGKIPLNRLTTDLISNYREMRLKQDNLQGNNRKIAVKKRRRGVQDSTINREVGLLRSALRDLARRRPQTVQALPYFPMESEKDNVRQGFLSDEQFTTKLYPALPRHLRAIAACAFYSGGRKGEWLRVDWEWVDFDRRTIFFPKTKNRKPREVPIIEGLMLDSLTEGKRIRDAFWPECDAVFAYEGKRLTTFRTGWESAVRRAGLSHLKSGKLLFHDTRRSSNKLMRDSGVTQAERMIIMGHETDSMDRRYGIIDDQNLRSARDKIERRLRRVK